MRWVAAVVKVAVVVSNEYPIFPLRMGQDVFVRMATQTGFIGSAHIPAKSSKYCCQARIHVRVE